MLERIGARLPDGSLPIRTDLLETNDKELIIRAVFLKQLVTDFNDFKAYPKGIDIKNALIIGDLDLSKVEASPSVTFFQCIFLGTINLEDSWFQRGLSVEESHFLGESRFGTLKVDHSADFNNAVFWGPVNFTLANIASNFAASGARFESTEKEATFNSLQVGYSAHFNNAVFGGQVDFTLANIASNFEARGARFESTEKEATFNSLKVGHSAHFDKAVFLGPVDFGSVTIGSDFNADEAHFEYTKKGPDFDSLKVGKNAFFTDAVFQGPVNFGWANVGGLHLRGTKFENAKKITLEGLTYKKIATKNDGCCDYETALEILTRSRGITVRNPIDNWNRTISGWG